MLSKRCPLAVAVSFSAALLVSVLATADGDMSGIAAKAFVYPPQRTSWHQLMAQLPADLQKELVTEVDAKLLTDLESDWRFKARYEQLPPQEAWSVFIPLGGRGSGKTWTGANWIIDGHRRNLVENSAIVGATSHDTRKFCVEGISGILEQAPKDFRPEYKPSTLKLVWPNGSASHLYSSETPDRLRGPNHDRAWADEMCSWKYLQETWDNLEMTLRSSNDPQTMVTTTPKPRTLFRELLNDPETLVRVMSTYDNAANLSRKWLARMERRYANTSKGRQELFAELLDEAEGALWQREWINSHTVRVAPELRRVVVAIDPAASNTETSDETGIVVAGDTTNQIGVVLEDLSGRFSPNGWARIAVKAYHQYNAAAIVAEKNNGGDMVAATIKTAAKELYAQNEAPTPFVNVKMVWASKGKQARAEPVAALSEQGRLLWMGKFPELSDQCCTWEPGGAMKSPDRLDALTWSITYLLLDHPAEDWNSTHLDVGRLLTAATPDWESDE